MRVGVLWRLPCLLALLLSLPQAGCLTLCGRRSLAPLALVAAAAPASCLAAEPVPAPACDDACMAARVARKRELLANQDRKAKAGTAAIFGADWQKGVREEKAARKPDAASAGFSSPFLLPGDVGGVNLQRK
ncbi:hypothetical protein EMIHUDRAFT_219578 [Emiliania huxleyi CCMP1516]|uniref:Uncharacterized protein n=2 Tax=Emiliania huxleyi TaxID=2903 RepID=A0A0D3I3R0_EMIH1|nr:hypothetical protein EMIHUDRAFT_219578 [Emiliania huxleyi CCMP1516]EOD05895.1 hypothetical protein EMIHUDRAFT_219578 [Emiliania huxleyi CCMP1516]|eukprot:XP_005758324.1 hypothetical protein EMIHUDRAFT_219578 [Emiliania huxleyi CCMP1516]